MSEKKWTPGPWDILLPCGVVKKGGSVFPLAVDETRFDGESWLQMRERTELERSIREDEKRSNEVLALSAPELYEALEAAKKRIEVACHDHGMTDEDLVVLGQIDAAMAKARGKQS